MGAPQEKSGFLSYIIKIPAGRAHIANLVLFCMLILCFSHRTKSLKLTAAFWGAFHIFIDGKFAYIFVHKDFAPLILSELKTISRNPVILTEADSLPDSFHPKTEDTEISVTSNRADAMISRLYNLSRDESSALFKSGFVALNGKELGKSEKALKNGDVITVRGKGKFIFISECDKSKKGKLYVKLNVYK